MKRLEIKVEVKNESDDSLVEDWKIYNTVWPSHELNPRPFGELPAINV